MDWMQILQSFCFPVTACIGLAWYVKVLTDNYRKDVKEMRSESREDAEKTREVLQSNILILQKVADKLDVGKDENV